MKKGWLITGIILCALSVLDLLGRLFFDFGDIGGVGDVRGAIVFIIAGASCIFMGIKGKK